MVKMLHLCVQCEFVVFVNLSYIRLCEPKIGSVKFVKNTIEWMKL